MTEPSVPIRCPFQEAYNVKYSDLLHGFCDADASYAKPCAAPSKYRVQFKHCEKSALYNGKGTYMPCPTAKLSHKNDASDFFVGWRL